MASAQRSPKSTRWLEEEEPGQTGWRHSLVPRKSGPLVVGAELGVKGVLLSNHSLLKCLCCLSMFDVSELGNTQGNSSEQEEGWWRGGSSYEFYPAVPFLPSFHPTLTLLTLKDSQVENAMKRKPAVILNV